MVRKLPNGDVLRDGRTVCPACQLPYRVHQWWVTLPLCPRVSRETRV